MYGIFSLQSVDFFRDMMNMYERFQVTFQNKLPTIMESKVPPPQLPPKKALLRDLTIGFP